MRLKLKEILANPFRDVKRNPLDEAKVAELVSSIHDTGFWDNVVVRKNKAGKFELAYGHHRIAAAIKAGIVEADFIVKKLDDAMMLKIMARENSETYKYSVLALIESVRGVVEALADGRIPAFEIDPKTNAQHLRNAPSYAVGASSPKLGEHPYTTVAVARFLGYTKKKDTDADNCVVAALNALELMQKGILDDRAIQGLKINQLLVMTRDIKKRLEKTSAAAKVIQADVKKHTEQMAKLDADRHAAEQAYKERQEELRRKETEAHKAEDEKAAKEWAEEQRVAKERAAERRLIFETKRAGLDAKIEESKERADAAQTRDKNLSTRYAVSTMLGKLKTIVSERNAFREEIKALSRDKAVTAAERENLRQAFLAAGDWYTEQAISFRPSVYVDVLKEARNKEAAKQKRESAQ
jgi:hypothetical protein